MAEILNNLYNTYIVALLPCITAVISVIMVLVKIINTAKETKTITSEAFKKLKESLDNSTITSEQYNTQVNTIVKDLKTKTTADITELVRAVEKLTAEIETIKAENKEILDNYSDELMKKAIIEANTGVVNEEEIENN